MMELPERCPRDLRDCMPLCQVIDDDGEGFICCGHNSESSRTVPGDLFRHCWKNSTIDELSDWDHRDIITTIYVLSGALTAHANIVENSELKS